MNVIKHLYLVEFEWSDDLFYRGGIGLEKREQWGTRTGFVLAAIGSAVGLGNIWRYPYIAYENGGGAFLIPYLFALLTAGISILVLEYAIGQKMRGSSPLSFRRLSKKWEWMGWWQTAIAFVILTYYIVIIGWAISFTYFSFGKQWGNETETFMLEQYLQFTSVSDNIWKIGGINWTVFGVVTLAWVITYFIMYRGIRKGIEKASKVLLPLLLVMLIIITIRGVTLPGAQLGLNALLEPNWSAMKDPKVWINAYGQIFFSLSIAFGIMITYASYLPKRSDLSNNAFIAAFTNSSVEFTAALAVFGALGFLAHSQGVPVEDVVSSGIVLAFIVFPEIINQLPAFGELFGIVFFGVLSIAGLTSVISIAEVCVSAVMEKFDLTRRKAVSYVCGLGFIGSVLYSTNAGMGYLDIVDGFINNYGIVLAGLIEIILLGWFFKLSTLRDHVNQLSDIKIGAWWVFSLKYLTPLVLIGMTGYNLYQELFVEHYGGGAYTLSQLVTFGWSVAFAVLILGFLFQWMNWKNEKRLEK